MKKRYNFTLDSDVYEEASQYIDNMSAFINNCLKRKIDTAKQVRSTFEGKGYNEETRKKFEEFVDLARTPWTQD